MDDTNNTNQQPPDDHLSDAEAAQTLEALREEHKFDTSTDDQDEP